MFLRAGAGRDWLTVIDESSFPESELRELWARLKPAFSRAGWLAGQWPEPRAGWFVTPLEAIPLLLVELPAAKEARPVFCLTQDRWLPEERSLYQRYVDAPFLVRALQAELEAGAGLRLQLFSPGRAWHFSAATDRAASVTPPDRPLPAHALERPSMRIPDASEADLGPRRFEGIPPARELRDWLRHWENELGAALEAGREEVRALLFTLALCRTHQALARPDAAPRPYPPAVWRPRGVEAAGAGEWESWRRPTLELRRILADCPAQWHPAPLASERVVNLLEGADDEAVSLLLRRMLGEYAQLAAVKFDPECLMQALCTSAEIQRAWKLALTRPVYVPAASGGPDGLARQPIEFDCERDSPGRLADWVDALLLYWRAHAEKELIDATDRADFAFQQDWLNPAPERPTRRELLMHRLRGGLATSLRVSCDDGSARLRCKTILTALALRLVLRTPGLRGAKGNLAEYWMGEKCV